MTEFSYRARDASGRMRRGRIVSGSVREAARSLTERGLFILRLRPSGAPLFFALRVDRRFPAVLCRQLATMLSAGMTIGEALRALAGRARKGPEGRIAASLYRAVADGGTLSEAMARYPRVFGRTAAALVGAGERSGSLDVLLGRLASSLEAEYAAREKLLTLMLYPCVLFLAVLSAVAFLAAFVFPVFASMFQSLSMELPPPTRAVLAALSFVRVYGLWLAGAAFALLFAAARLYRREACRVRMDRALLAVPVLGGLMRAAETARLADTLSVLLASGLVLDGALAILEGVTGNAFLRRALCRAHSEVQKGVPLSGALRREGVLPPLFLELLWAGEATGETGRMLERIAAFSRLELDTGAERVRALLPPLSLLLLGGLVGLIVFSVVLPMLDGMTAFL